jgi:hypothetical protein
MRNFKDAAGIDWTVFEVRRQSNEEDNWAYLPRGFRSGWLCFESDGGKRRLSPVPDGWKSLDAPDLERMLRRASAVGKIPRAINANPAAFDRQKTDEDSGAPA